VSETTTEEAWDQKLAEPNEAEPGGGPEPDGGPEEVEVTAVTPEMVEEEEEVPKPKVAPCQPDAPKKEHVNVVFIGHVGQWSHAHPLVLKATIRPKLA
jgi:peptide chain release factor subunit 3